MVFTWMNNIPLGLHLAPPLSSLWITKHSAVPLLPNPLTQLCKLYEPSSTPCSPDGDAAEADGDAVSDVDVFDVAAIYVDADDFDDVVIVSLMLHFQLHCHVMRIFTVINYTFDCVF